MMTEERRHELKKLAALTTIAHSQAERLDIEMVVHFRLPEEDQEALDSYMIALNEPAYEQNPSDPN